MNSNNGGTNQVEEQQDALYLACQSLMQWNAKYPSKAYTDYKIAVAADKELSEIIKSIGIAMNTRGAYAASRSVGYSLEQVGKIVVEFDSFRKDDHTDFYKQNIRQFFNKWSQTPEGKSLLERSAVGVQDGSAGRGNWQAIWEEAQIMKEDDFVNYFNQRYPNLQNSKP